MKRFDTMNVIPLIDVMLVLLAIVLLTASFIVHDKLDIELPQTEHTQASSTNTPDVINLALDKTGLVYWQGETVALEQIPAKISAISKDTPLHLKVDLQVEFQHFVALMDKIKLQQHDNLTILTERK
ncbi:MAG: biopolymer transporter ExbD [Thiomicrospira sp.]|jgi:biopolymer transport protein ExbD|nr:biopolymer transporter ExbD [Thiomicrospira sp.]